MNLLALASITALLVAEGTSLCWWIQREKSWLGIAVGLPLASLMNVFVIFFLTVSGIALTAWSILLPHGCILVISLFHVQRLPWRTEEVKHQSISWLTRVATWIAATVIGMVMIYSAVHAIYLPTFQYDSATNWTMRSKVSFEDRHIAFDPTEDRGVAKPQYPFLFHALQVTANQINRQTGRTLISSWSDRNANTILWLLSVTTFVSLFLLLRERRGSHHALMVLGLILSTPLFALHTAQGYGDLNLAQYTLLSIAFVASATEESNEERRQGLWILSMFMATAGAWTKSEGLFVTLLPWCVITIWYGRKQLKQTLLTALAPSMLCTLPWYLYAVLHDLRLSPHATDSSFAWHSEAPGLVAAGLFGRGSFGVSWYAIVLLLLCTVMRVWNTKKDHPSSRFSCLPIVLWGIYVTMFFLFVYICTPNVEFLINAQAFYRQLMIPCVLLIFVLGFLWTGVASEGREC